MAAAPNGLKVMVVGPKSSGKTSISNFLAGQADTLLSPEGAAAPTVGCRILEFEIASAGSGRAIPIELWDTGGDTEYEACWPAIRKDASALVLVYNPEKQAHLEEIGIWYEEFSKELSDDQQILVFSHSASGAKGARPPPRIAELNVLNTDADSASAISSAFTKFMGKVEQIAAKKGEQ